MKRLSGILTLLSLVFSLTACGLLPFKKPDDPHFAPLYPASRIAPPKSDGSIYQLGYSQGLFEDQRARRVGDIITVILNEKTVSKKSSETSLSKDNSTSVGGMSLHGLALSTAMEGGREFSGSADTDQSNSLKGSITLTVVEVLPNGVLSVRGEKWITLTRGEELIRVSGLVRPRDIEKNNTVLSGKLANSRITYSGRGELADTNRMGWFARIFVSPFFFF